jgi:hypothetical protein
MALLNAPDARLGTISFVNASASVDTNPTDE